MSSKTLVSMKIDGAISNAHRALTKPLGFKKRARNLTLSTNDLVHVISVRASRWGSGDSGNFTISLEVIWPHFHKVYCSRPLPPNPASGIQAISCPLIDLIPKTQKHYDCWHVDRNTETELLSADIQFVLQEYGLPHLARFRHEQDLIAYLLGTTGHQGAGCSQDYVRAAALCRIGKSSEASDLLRKCISPSRPMPWDETVRAVMKGLGLENVI